MYINEEEMVLLSCTRKTGIGKKSGQPYDFYIAQLGDAQFNKFDAIVSDDLKTFDGSLVPILRQAAEGDERPVKVLASFTLVPRGFSLSLTLRRIDER